MIRKDLFMSKLKKASLLIGYPIETDVADALYEELKKEHEKDIILSLKDIAYTGERLNLANIYKHIISHRTVRIEKEAQEYKNANENAVNEMLKKEDMPEEVKTFLKNLKHL